MGGADWGGTVWSGHETGDAMHTGGWMLVTRSNGQGLVSGTSVGSVDGWHDGTYGWRTPCSCRNSSR
eukprot:812148-Prorocentrum_lima.AAC.1